VHLAIFGGTGTTGRRLVEQALQAGHEVSALARDPGKLPTHERLRPVAGDACNPEPVTQTIKGAAAVLSALGQRKWGTTICADAMRNILPAMNAHGVHRLLAVSGYGVGDSRHRNLYVATVWLTIRSLMRDKEQMEALIRSSDTEWTIIRPAVLSSTSHTGRYRTGTDLRLNWTSKVSVADLADFMLSQLAPGSPLRQTVAITSWPGKHCAHPVGVTGRALPPRPRT
jgi:putative NADH-flavin reductase